MEKKKTLLIIGLISLLLIAIACDISFGGSQKEDDQALQLQLTQQSLQLTQQALANADKQPPADSGSKDTDSDEDDTESSTSDDEADEEDGDGSPCNRSKMVSETISDYTVFQPGDTFEKTWTVRNEGTCTWTEDYTFRFTQGTRMNGASSMRLPREVEPGDTLTVALELTAPDDPDTYTGRWEFFDEEGDNFGWYSVVINVSTTGGAPAPAPSTFAVTSVVFDPSHPSVDMACPNSYVARAEIFASGAGKVTYKWTDSAGGSSTKSVNFSSAGSKIVEYTTADITATGDYTASLYIDEPNHQAFGAKSFHINCTP